MAGAISRIGSNGSVDRDKPSAGHEAVHNKLSAQEPAKNAKVQEVAKLYERQFLGEMFKAMRSTINETDKSSMAQGIYKDQLDDQYVDAWSEQGGIGLSNIIYDQIMDRFFQQTGQGKALKKQGPIALTDRDILKVEKMGAGGPQVLVPQKPAAQAATLTSETPKSLPELSKSEASSVLDSQTALRVEVRPSDTGQPAKIQAPWDARVVRTAQIDGSRKVVTLEHGAGLRSTLVFEGAMNAGLKQGDVIAKGDAVGTLSADAKSFLWNLAPQTPVE